MNRSIGISIGVLALLLVGSVAWAQGGPSGRRGNGGQGGPGGEQHQKRLIDHIAYGEIISITAGQIVIAPEIPDEMAQRITQRGHELPELPARLEIELNAETSFTLNSGMASIADFSAGDKVVVVRDRSGIARSISDLESARQFMEERRSERRAEGGPGGERGMRRPPAMGSITAISADSITITPMIPQELQQKMQEHGRELPELPASLSWSIDSETRFVTVDGKQDTNPFSVGDVVVVLGPPEKGSARAIVSPEAARERIEQAMEGRGGPGGKKGGRNR